MPSFSAGHENIVKMLVENGSDVNACDQNENSPLHMAAEAG